MRQHRADPYPWTWELPVGVATAVGIVLVLGVHAGRGVACLLAGHGFRWTRQGSLFTALRPILSGDAGAGLAEPVPGVSAGVLAWSIIGVEAACLAVCLWAAREALTRWGPAAVKGVATASEAEELLGCSRLRAVRAVVRPDLYGPKRQATRGAEAEAGTR